MLRKGLLERGVSATSLCRQLLVASGNSKSKDPEVKMCLDTWQTTQGRFCWSSEWEGERWVGSESSWSDDRGLAVRLQGLSKMERPGRVLSAVTSDWAFNELIQTAVERTVGKLTYMNLIQSFIFRAKASLYTLSSTEGCNEQTTKRLCKLENKVRSKGWLLLLFLYLVCPITSGRGTPHCQNKDEECNVGLNFQIRYLTA